PLVNYKNSAILGISSIDNKLQRCYLTLTFDHRITEGKRVAEFLSALKNRIESFRNENNNPLVNDISCYKCRKKLKDDLANIAFVKCITPQGMDSYVCQSCFKGF
ncbi:MAG: 2-oxo acid dehydrogenase subunit E2, partial [Ferruginibacter sp.]|nr:2-oxo acid dehydrogenase subunit E2 [Ferruginibacter sp.]